jgi:glycosyltransferase 2 family protein
VTDAPRTRLSPLFRRIFVTLIVVGVVFFFSRAVQQNWGQIRAHRFELDYPLLMVSFATVIAASLLATYAWQVMLNALSGKHEMTFAKSVATVNTTSLTKYLPGKFWSYALQMYWLARSGYSKSLVLYVNLTNLIVSLLMGVLLAVGFLLAAQTFAWQLVLAAFTLVALADLVCVRYYGPAFGVAGALGRRLFKRDIGNFDMPTSVMLRVHWIHLMSQLVSGAGGYALCYAIGYRLDTSTILLVMASLILSDAAGFVFFLVPGGLGIREATMYLLLHEAKSAGSLALVLPLVSRALYMLADVLLGLVALWLLRRSVRASEA